MNVHLFDTKADASKAAAAQIAALIQQTPAVTLGLATGASPVLVYQYLRELHPPMRQVQSVNLDEYIGLSPDDPASFYQYMETHYVQPFQLTKAQVQRPNGALAPNEALAQYREVLQRVSIDLQLLGIGSNGHIGFNEPGCDFLDDVHIETLSESTKRANQAAFGSMDKVPQQAITMGIKTIMSAKRIVLLAFGEAKAEAVYHMIHGPVTNQVPASILQTHPRVDVYLDHAAASLLPK
jgi:glucosamine-6-phosphate deaminase